MLTKKFERLLVIRPHNNDKHGNKMWECLCDCGDIIIVRGSELRAGNIRSCGCLRRDTLINKLTTHNLSNTRLYQLWAGMKSRCTDPKNSGYPNYGGRGITVCDRWLESFENYYEDNIEAYLEHVNLHGEMNTSAERPDVNGNYEPTNFRWATKKEQASTRRNSIVTNNPQEHRKWKGYFSYNIHYIIHGLQNPKTFCHVYLGCLPEEFKQYIESQFTEGMTWDNYGIGKGKWSIDHILRCREFDLSIEEDRKECFYYTNLQPMWWMDNRFKG